MAIITVTNNTDNGNGSLRNAIALAQSGDTIKFASGLTNQTITLDKSIVMRKSLTLDGSDASGLTISGGEKTNLFRLAQENQNLTLRDLTLADSYNKTGVGGAVWAAENSTVNLENTEFLNHVSQGAALHAQEGSNVTVIDSLFDNNDGTVNSTKPFSGGAISVFGYGSLTVKGSTFTNNKGLNGGALRVTVSDLLVEDSIFTGNDSSSGGNKNFMYVPGGGGAIYLDGASVPSDPRFYSGNLQRETEGGVFKVVNSHFENNRAAGEGGAILAYGYNQDQVIIQDSKIINNEVIKNLKGFAKGGGLRLSGFVEIDNTVIDNNQSANEGGGIYLQGEVPAKISNSSFSGNEAVKGGAIYNKLWNSEIEITDTNFDSNSATNEAGAFYNENDTLVSFQDSQFSDNTPKDLNNLSFGRNIPDIVSGTNSNDTLVGNDENSYLIGLKGKDNLTGNEGHDYLDGGANNDNLFGGIGNDTLVGGDGINNLVGGNGNDIFMGGNGQNLIEGGNGRDLYIIGDENQIYYTNQRWYDHAIIQDFQPQNDTIQLHGQASDYTVKTTVSQGISGTGIFYNNGLVALVGDMSPSNFNLNAEYISYGDSTNNVEPPEEDRIELTSDSVFSGEPDYNPANHNGLIVWNNDDTWHLEATGDANGERLTGRIISDSPIEDLRFDKIENSDTVEFVDNSNEILEFDLRVWNRGIDGLSFEVADDASVFIELDNSSDVSVKAGSDLQEVNLSNM